MDEPSAPAAPARPVGAEPPAGAAPPPAVIEALARLLAAATVYPPTHPRIAEIVEPVLAAVRAAAGDSGRLRIAMTNDVQSDGATAAAKRLLRDLDSLGIARIEIDHDASVADLFAFARFLRQYAASRSGDGGFHHIDFGELPWTIHVQERSFGLPTFREDEVAPGPLAEGGVAGDGPGFVQLSQSSEPVDETIVALVRRSVGQILAGRGVKGDPEFAIALSLDEARSGPRAVAEAVRKWIERQVPATSSTATPAQILADAEKTLPQILPGVDWSPVLDGIRRTIDAHLRDGFRAETRAEFDRRTAVPLETAKTSASNADLCRSIAEFTAGAEPFGLVTSMDRAEHLSILLHLLGESPDAAAGQGILRRLGPCLADALGDGERAALVGWLRDVALRDDPGVVDQLLVPVAGALRIAGRGALARDLIEACRPPHRERATALWPHLAHELVTAGGDSDVVHHEELADLVAGVPASRVRAEAARLTGLVALRTDRPARDVFSPPREPLHPIYEVLLATPREAGFSAAVTSAFMKRPPSHPAAAALMVLQSDEERAHRLIARVLREGASPTSASRALASEILVAALRAAPPGRRGNPWVQDAVRALSTLPGAETTEMLREVCRARRFFVGWAWPSGARHVAGLALRIHGAARPADAAAEATA